MYFPIGYLFFFDLGLFGCLLGATAIASQGHPRSLQVCPGPRAPSGTLRASQCGSPAAQSSPGPEPTFAGDSLQPKCTKMWSYAITYTMTDFENKGTPHF